LIKTNVKTKFVSKNYLIFDFYLMVAREGICSVEVVDVDDVVDVGVARVVTVVSAVSLVDWGEFRA